MLTIRLLGEQFYNISMLQIADRMVETNTANKKLEEEKVKNKVLEADNKSMQTELELAKQKLTDLENEIKL